MSTELYRLSEELGRALKQRGWQLTTAESCTGGWIAQSITAVPGSSAWFDWGVVSYSNLAKEKLLAVPRSCLDGPQAPGAVSEETVTAMARGALKNAGADLAVATSGVAGPGGGSPEKPVGTVWIGWAMREPGSPTVAVRSQCHRFTGERQAVRYKSVVVALEGSLEIVNNQERGARRNTG